MDNVTCILCDKKEHTELFRNEKIRVEICLGCGFAYLNPRMTALEYMKYYRDGYQASRHLLHDYDEAVARLLKKKSYEQKKKHLSFFDGFITDKTRVFEIGAGWGTFLKVIQDAYQGQVKGLEISSLAARVAREHYKLPIIESTFETYLLERKEKETFDFILMHHVLEHFLNPLQILRDVKELLSPNGLLYIAVPNLSAPDEALSKFFRIEHCSYWYPRTLEKILKKAGYTIIKMKIGPTDMKFIAAKEGSLHPAVSVPDEDPRAVVRTIARRKALDGTKEKARALLEHILPKAWVEKMRKLLP